jgi:hypothetical protein
MENMPKEYFLIILIRQETQKGPYIGKFSTNIEIDCDLKSLLKLGSSEQRTISRYCTVKADAMEHVPMSCMACVRTIGFSPMMG